MFEVGRLCIKTAGREAGRYCVVLKRIDPKFVLITGPKELTKVKRRKCNIAHLEPLPYTVKLSEDASDAEVLKVYAAEGIYEKLGLTPPTKESKTKEAEEKAEQVRKAKSKKTERVKKEKPRTEQEEKKVSRQKTDKS